MMDLPTTGSPFFLSTYAGVIEKGEIALAEIKREDVLMFTQLFEQTKSFKDMEAGGKEATRADHRSKTARQKRALKVGKWRCTMAKKLVLAQQTAKVKQNPKSLLAAKRLETKSHSQLAKIGAKHRRIEESETKLSDQVQAADGKLTILEHIHRTADYLYKIDDRQTLLPKAFRLATIRAGLCKGIKIKKAHIRGMLALRKAFKSESYRQARLRPRASDEDFAEGEDLPAADDTMEDQDVPSSRADADAVNRINTAADKLKTDMPMLAEFMAKSPSATPITSHVGAAMLLNASMLALFSKVRDAGNTLKSHADASQIVAEAVSEELAKVVPAQFHVIAALLDDVRKLDPSVDRASISPELCALVKDSTFIDATLVNMLTCRLFLHVISTVGAMPADIELNGLTVRRTYLDPITQSALCELSTQLEAALVAAQAAPDSNVQPVRPAVQLLDVLRVASWTDFITDLMKELQSLSEHCEKHNCKAYNVQKDEFAILLQKGTVTAIQDRCKILQLKLGVRVFDKKAELFPTSRSKLAATCMGAFEKVNASSAEASVMLATPLDVVRERLLKTHNLATSNKAVDASQRATGSLDSQLVAAEEGTTPAAGSAAAWPIVGACLNVVWEHAVATEMEEAKLWSPIATGEILYVKRALINKIQVTLDALVLQQFGADNLHATKLRVDVEYPKVAVLLFMTASSVSARGMLSGPSPLLECIPRRLLSIHGSSRTMDAALRVPTCTPSDVIHVAAIDGLTDPVLCTYHSPRCCLCRRYKLAARW